MFLKLQWSHCLVRRALDLKMLRDGIQTEGIKTTYVHPNGVG